MNYRPVILKTSNTNVGTTTLEKKIQQSTYDEYVRVGDPIGHPNFSELSRKHSV